MRMWLRVHKPTTEYVYCLLWHAAQAPASLRPGTFSIPLHINPGKVSAKHNAHIALLPSQQVLGQNSATSLQLMSLPLASCLKCAGQAFCIGRVASCWQLVSGISLNSQVHLIMSPHNPSLYTFCKGQQSALLKRMERSNAHRYPIGPTSCQLKQELTADQGESRSSNPRSSFASKLWRSEMRNPLKR